MHLDAAFRRHGPEALATLIRVLGDFDLAEEGLQEAFAAATLAWPRDPPANPRAWLISVGRRRALERITGRIGADDILGVIFATFCIGK